MITEKFKQEVDEAEKQVYEINSASEEVIKRDLLPLAIKCESLRTRIGNSYSRTRTSARPIKVCGRSINGLSSEIYVSKDEQYLRRRVYELWQRLGRLKAKYRISLPKAETPALIRIFNTVDVNPLCIVRKHFNIKSASDFIDVNVLRTSCTNQQGYEIVFCVADRLVSNNRVRISFSNLVAEFAVEFCEEMYKVETTVNTKEVLLFRDNVLKKIFS